MFSLDADVLAALEDSRDQCDIIATAFYGSDQTIPSERWPFDRVPLLTQGQLTFTATGQTQTIGSAYLAADADPDNPVYSSLVPYNDTDPLAPNGQELAFAYRINYGGEQWDVPLGRYRIQDSPQASEFAYLANGKSRPIGWSIQLDLVDRIDILLNDDFLAATGPTMSTVKAEVQMLCLQSGVPFVWPATIADVAIPSGTVYSAGRLDAITQLLTLVGCEPAMTRQGELTLRVSNSWLTATTPVATVTGATQLTLARSNSIYNYVVVTNPNDATIQGIAAITDPADPRNINGPLRRRTYTNSNPLAADAGTAAAMAQTILARVSTRTAKVATVTCMPVPHLEGGDFIAALDPSSGNTVTGVITGMTIPLDPTAAWTLTLTVVEVLRG